MCVLLCISAELGLFSTQGVHEIGAGYRTSVNSSLQFTSSTQEKENYEIVELAQCWIGN